MEYLRTIQAGDDDLRRAARALGALLLGVGVLVLAYRKSGFEDPWGEFPLFLLAILPALFLYGGGFLAARSAPAPRAWHRMFLVFGLIFVFFACFQFIALVDGDTGSDLNLAWVSALIAVLGVLAALRADVPFGLLVAGVAASLAWLALWSEILGDDFNDAGTVRGLAVLAAVIVGLAGLALYLRQGGARSLRALDDPAARMPAELITAAGVVFLFGTGVLSASGAIVSGFLSSLGPLVPADAGSGIAEPSLFWDLVLLLGSLKLVVLGTRMQMRGPAYVGGIGLAIFVAIVGLDLDDDSPSGAIVGWPLILLLLAAALLAASVLLPARDSSPGSSDPP